MEHEEEKGVRGNRPNRRRAVIDESEDSAQSSDDEEDDYAFNDLDNGKNTRGRKRLQKNNSRAGAKNVELPSSDGDSADSDMINEDD